MNSTNTQFPPLVLRFLEYLKRVRCFSDNTARAYGTDLFQFCRFIAGVIGHHGHSVTELPASDVVDGKLLGVQTPLANEFMDYLYAQGYTLRSVARKLATLRSFYKFLVCEGGVSFNPLSAIKTPRHEKRQPRCPEPDQIQKLLDTPGNADILAARDTAILHVLYSSGIRASELVGLKIEDVDLQDGLLRVRGHGERLASINKRALDALRKYINLRNNNGSTPPLTGTVFLNKHGGPLSARAVRSKLEKYAKSAGLDPAISPQQLRYGFARNMLDLGVDKKSVQGLLGLRSPVFAASACETLASLNG